MRTEVGEGGAAVGAGIDAQGAQSLAELGCGEGWSGVVAGEQPGGGGG